MTEGRLLVISRDSDISEQLRSYYTDQNYEVQITSKEDEAVAIVKSETPSALIVNTVSGVDGRMIRHRIGSLPVPIIFIVPAIMGAVKLGLPTYNRDDTYTYLPIDFGKLDYRLHKALEASKIRKKGKIRQVLMISDNPEMIERIGNYFESHRLKLSVVAEGATAIPLLLKLEWTQQPEAIILDIPLADMELNEFLRLLRYKLKTSYIPLVLLIEKYDIWSNITDEFTRGFDDYLVKPFELEQLVTSVINAIHSVRR
jgi:DNA-binding response OmpR family regulator